MAPASLPESLLGCAVAAALAAGLGALLRSCGIRASWITAGVCVGALLGAGGLGRAMPAWHDRYVAGAAMERRETFVAARAIELAQMAALPQGARVDSDDLASLESQLHAAQERERDARANFDQPAVWLVALLGAFVMVGASPLLGRTTWWRHGGPAIGVWHVALPAAMVVLTLSVMDASQPQAWWMYAIATISVGCATLGSRETWTASRMLGAGVRSLDSTRGMAGVLALVLAALTWWTDGRDATAWMLPWGAMLAAWGLASEPPAKLMRLAGPVTAGAVAIAMTRLDVTADWRGWIVLGVFVAAEDMKWLGAGVGLSLWSRTGWTRSLRATMPLADGSRAQAVLASVAVLEGLVPAWMGLALLVSAAAVELLEPVRRRTALRLDQSLHASGEA
jgi:hypothetical protein